jgi:hypothetical protein
MEREPEQPTQAPIDPVEEPPPFQPDPDLIAYLEHGGKPSGSEVQEMAQGPRGQNVTR